VLLAALLRADGIPARVAFGAVWVPRAGSVRNAYGWHMWTQALVDGSWIDLDATLGGTRFDAARLLTGTSAADGASLDTDLSRVVNMIGDLEIELVEVDGRPVAPVDPVDGAKGKPR
jgi:transglutaminase-like putative cysteine protease